MVALGFVGVFMCGCLAGCGSPVDYTTKDMRQFDCWTSWCNQGRANPPSKYWHQDWNYGPIDKCATWCLEQDNCTGFMSAGVPLSNGKCVITYNDWCQPGEGATGGAIFTAAGSHPKACHRVSVSIRGDWVPILSLDSATVDRRVKVGKTETTTAAWNYAVGAAAEGISAEMSGSYEYAVQMSKEEETTHHFDPAGGKQVWQWILKVYQKNKHGYITIKTQDLVQSAHKGQVPKCLPGWFKGKTSENMCIHDKYVSKQKVHT